MPFTKVAPAGIGTEPGSSILIGDSLLHSTGIDIGNNTGAGVTIRQHGDATFTGIITASAFFGDGSGLEGVSSSGIGTPLSDDDTSDLNKIYYVNQELSIGSTITVNHPSSAVASYTHYQDLVVTDDADFIVSDGDTFIPDVLGIRTSTSTTSAPTGGRIRAGTITNAAANGAPNFPNGLTGTTGTFTGNLNVGGVLTYEDVTNVDSIGIVTARGGIRIGGGTTVGPISGIVTYFGDGSQLTGISAGTALSGSTNNTIVTVTGANAIQGESSFTYDGNGGLDMEGTGAAFIQIKTPNNTDGGVYFRTGSSNPGAISYLHTDNSMNFRVNSTTKLKITSQGYVTKPNTVNFLAISSSNNVNLGSGDKMPFNAEEYDVGGVFNTSTYQFTAPVAGNYFIFYQVYRNSSTGAEVAMYRDSTVIRRNRPQPSSGDYIFAQSTVVNCTAGQTIDIRAYNGNLDAFYGNSDTQYSNFGGYLLG